LLFQNCVGIEISDNYLSIVSVKDTLGGPRIIRESQYPFDAKQSLRRKMDSAKRYFKNFLLADHFEMNGLYVGIPQNRVFQREIFLPSPARGNIANTIRYEIEKYLPVAFDDIHFDYQVLDEDKDTKQIRVLLVAIRQTDLSVLTDFIKSADIDAYGIEPTGSSLTNLVASSIKLPKDGHFTIVYKDTSSLCIINGEKGTLVRSVTMPIDSSGDEQFSSFHLQLRSSRNGGGSGDNSNSNPIYCLGSDIHAEMSDQVRQLNIEPTELIALKLNRFPIGEWDYAVAYGLALKGLRDLPAKINLLPRRFRKKSSQLSSYLILLMILISFVSCFSWFGSKIVQQKNERALISKEIQKLSGLVEKTEIIDGKLHLIKERIAGLAELESGGIPALKILKNISEILPETAWLKKIEMISGDNGVRVRLGGYADNANDLVPLLDNQPQITDVETLSGITRERNGKEKFMIGLIIKKIK